MKLIKLSLLNNSLFLLSLVSFASCSQTNSDQDKIAIRDNLYYDNNGNLYLKSINREDIENETTFDVWLTTIHCDTCYLPVDECFQVLYTLKDFVDTATFHFEYFDTISYSSIYQDKNHIYHHRLMADGGFIYIEN